MLEWSTFIEGIPKPQPRPRCRIYTVRGKTVPSIYSPVTPWRKVVRSWINDHYDAEPLEGPLRVSLFFTVPRLKTVQREGPIGKSEGDIDNLVKAVLDAFNGVLFVDDAQVTELHASKHYPREELERHGVSVYVKQLL